jgi:hypothetical protein
MTLVTLIHEVDHQMTNQVVGIMAKIIFRLNVLPVVNQWVLIAVF